MSDVARLERERKCLEGKANAISYTFLSHVHPFSLKRYHSSLCY